MKNNARFFLTIGAIYSLIGFSSFPVYGATIKASIDSNLFGNLDQGKTNCPLLGCGPTAFTNSLAYLQRKFSKLYEELLIPDTNNNNMIDEAEMIAVANDISLNFMKNCSIEGCTATLIEDFIIGKRDYIESKVKGKTKFKAQMGIEWRENPPGGEHPGTKKPDFVQDKTIPTLNFIAKEIKEEEDVEIVVGNVVNGSPNAHFLTVTGISFDDETNKGTVSLVDPLGGKKITANILGLNNNFIELDYKLKGANTLIGHAISESAIVPESTSIFSFVVLGTIGVGSTIFSKKKQNKVD